MDLHAATVEVEIAAAPEVWKAGKGRHSLRVRLTSRPAIAPKAWLQWSKPTVLDVSAWPVVADYQGPDYRGRIAAAMGVDAITVEAVGTVAGLGVTVAPSRLALASEVADAPTQPPAPEKPAAGPRLLRVWVAGGTGRGAKLGFERAGLSPDEWPEWRLPAPNAHKVVNSYLHVEGVAEKIDKVRRSETSKGIENLWNRRVKIRPGDRIGFYFKNKSGNRRTTTAYLVWPAAWGNIGQ